MSKLDEPIEEDTYYEVLQQDWIPVACCDCSMVHNWYFKYEDGKIYAKCWVDKRSTAQFRRYRLGNLFGKHKKWKMIKK